MLRLANADVLPFEFTAPPAAIERYSKDVKKLADKLRDRHDRDNRQIEEGVFTLAADPAETASPRRSEGAGAVPQLRRRSERARSAEAAAAPLRRGAAAADRGRRRSTRRAPAADGALLVQAERALTSAKGLPRRPWFTHQIYAPGFYTGYGVKTLPGVREAIEERNLAEATAQIPNVAAADRALRGPRSKRLPRRSSRSPAEAHNGPNSPRTRPMDIAKVAVLVSFAVAKGQTNAGAKTRGAAGHARSDGAADARQHGPAARLRHRPAHRAGQRRHPEAERGHRLRLAHAAAAPAAGSRPAGAPRRTTARPSSTRSPQPAGGSWRARSRTGTGSRA